MMYDEEVGRQHYLNYIKNRKKTTYNKRIIISGLYIEEYTYEKSITAVKKKSHLKRDKKKKEQTEMNSGALRRTRMNITRLVNSNPDFITFATLTFDETKFLNPKDITGLETCNPLFMLFIQRLRYKHPDIKYLVVPEFQSDYYYRTGIKKEFGGAVHYHLLLNKSISSSELETIWKKQGFVKINKIKSIKNVGLYISAYLSKESFNKKYFGKKKFFYSKNLNKPQEFKGEECDTIKAIYLPMHTKVYEKSFESDYLGKIDFNLYKLNTEK